MGDLRHSTEARVAEGHEGVTGKEGKQVTAAQETGAWVYPAGKLS